ncbi:MAG: 50S ribosomal protein L11 methyltransferase [Muribaculaceae bacterium]|nr:50S ribosomal protein L11 methyltransferase [Muribaculaceae bacterium]
MHDYISLRIDTNPTNETITDLLAAFLADLEFESFEPDSKGITAYVRKNLFNDEAVRNIIAEFPIKTEFKISSREIKGEDWNKEWEQNYYEPIVIDNSCVIRATFHKDFPNCPIEIIIDPKMAFGTGHHFTTANMIRLLLNEDLTGKSVIDMGTGTGILAILCKKLGSSSVAGIEIDPYALENAIENGQLNGEKEIKWICGDAHSLEQLDISDYFLANINRNVILSDLTKYAGKLKKGGKLFLSGFYKSDLDIIENEAVKNSLHKVKELVDNEWVGAIFEKK